MYVIALSHDSKIADVQSVPHMRLRSYTSSLEGMTVLVASRGMPKQVQTDNLLVFLTGGSNYFSRFFNLVKEVYKQAKQWRGKSVVVVSQSPFELGLVGLLVAKLFGFDLNIQLHGDFFGNHFSAEGLVNQWRKKIGWYVIKKADTVRVVSSRIKNSLLAAGLPAQKIQVLPVHVSVERFFTATPNPIWQKILSPEAKVILSVGRFAPEKNLPLLLRAFAQAHAVVPEARLVLVGEGSERSMLEKIVLELFPSGNAPVMWYPWQSDIAGVMTAAYAYALASNHEGYALVLPEAMASGLPIVTTEVGCVGELFVPNVHGLAVSVGDEAGFASALIKLLTDQDLSQRYGEAGQKTMREYLEDKNTHATKWLATLTIKTS